MHHRALQLLPSGLRVALYHHLTDHQSPLLADLGVCTPPALFEAHVRRLVRDYEIVDLEQVLSARLPKRALLITFDDGYRSVVDVGLPILERLGVPSVFFISAAFVEPGSLPLDNVLCAVKTSAGLGAVCDAATGRVDAADSLAGLLAIVAELPYARRMALGDELADRFELDVARVRRDSGLFLDAGELAALPARGCAIGNHTRSHLFCRAIADDDAAREQLTAHREQLERWAGQPVRSFSYPYGSAADATPFVERALRASGHEASFLVQSRHNARSHTGPVWNRVSLRDRPVWRVVPELELLPLARSARDRLQSTTGARA